MDNLHKALGEALRPLPAPDPVPWMLAELALRRDLVGKGERCICPAEDYPHIHEEKA